MFVRTQKVDIISVLLLLLLALCCRTPASGDTSTDVNDVVTVTGVVGKSIVLPCRLPLSDPPKVQWADYAYNSDVHPQKIFQSAGNPSRRVDPTHPNQVNYRVDDVMSLTISDIKLNDDPGFYVCQSEVDGITHKLTYDLNVFERPQCLGVTSLRSGHHTSLECSAKYSGNTQPGLQWYRSEHPIDSSDLFDITLAKRVVEVHVTHSDNHVTYTCRMTYGETVEECSMVLNVAFLVRDIKFVPDKDKLRVGEELRCSAKGNPAPKISLSPSNPETDKSGDTWRALVVEPSWEGRHVTAHCTAENTLDDVDETLSRNITFTVIAAKKHHTTTTTTTTTPVVEVREDVQQDRGSSDNKPAQPRPVIGQKPTNSAQTSFGEARLLVVMTTTLWSAFLLQYIY